MQCATWKKALARKSCRQDRLSDAYEMEKNPEVERARNPCHSLHLVLSRLLDLHK